MTEKSLREVTDATWELDSILEQWFSRFHPNMAEGVRDKIIARSISYLFLRTHIANKEKT